MTEWTHLQGLFGETGFTIPYLISSDEYTGDTLCVDIL